MRSLLSVKMFAPVEPALLRPAPPARELRPSKPFPTAVAAEVPAPTAPVPTFDLSAVLANVALVNGALGACGGAEGARKVVEAVQVRGGVEPFLLHLDLITELRGTTTT